MKEKKLKFDGENLSIKVRRYFNNGRLAILAYTKDEIYGDITINLSGITIERNEGFINSLTKDSGLEKELIKDGIIKEVITSVNYNMGKYDLAVFDMDKLKEYDPIGVKEFQNENEEEME